MNDMGSHEPTFTTYLVRVVNALRLCSSDSQYDRCMTHKEMWDANLDHAPVELNVTPGTGVNQIYKTTWEGLFGG